MRIDTMIAEQHLSALGMAELFCRRMPSGPAKTLLAIALSHPKILRDIAAP